MTQQANDSVFVPVYHGANPEQFRGDISEDLARRAHTGTSHVPEDRARSERDNYAATMAADYSNLFQLATTEAQRAALPAEFERYRQGYGRRYRALLVAKSRCLSTMISGPSNFNSRRYSKSSDVADRRLSDLVDFRNRAMRALRRAVSGTTVIKSSDTDAAARLADKIAKLERLQETMKAANHAIRRHKGHDSQLAALVALGHSESLAAKMLTPDFAGRIGFPAYELTNNNANIRRLKGRLAAVQHSQATPDATVEGANARLEDAPADNRVRLFFPGIPSIEVRSRLKRSGFRWSPSIGAWQAFRNTSSIAVAREVAGVSS